MAVFITTLLITFGVIAALALLISYCRRRLRSSRHGLTGMCHRDGGPACASCGEGNKDSPPNRGNPSA